MIRFRLVLIFFIFLISSIGHTQDILSSIQEENSELDQQFNLNLEKILKISGSSRIFLISNDNSSFSAGDYISLIKYNKLVCRALAVKEKGQNSAIKIVKIYSMNLWNSLRTNDEVKVLRGDDTAFKTKPAENEDLDELKTSGISSEEDLFNEEKLLDEDSTLEEKSNRIIKQDNLAAVTYSQVESFTSFDNLSVSLNVFSLFWGYQIKDNFWGEVSYSRNLLADYPSSSIDTVVQKFALKLKYSIQAPYYSVLNPYIGAVITNAESPGAGIGTSKSTEQKAKEVQLVEDLKKTSLVFGVTVLKRLVPGWFIRIDLGSDGFGGGLALEF